MWSYSAVALLAARSYGIVGSSILLAAYPALCGLPSLLVFDGDPLLCLSGGLGCPKAPIGKKKKIEY